MEGDARIPLSSLQSWFAVMASDPSKRVVSKRAAEVCEEGFPHRDVAGALARRFYLVRGDITQLEVDAIVNAANNFMCGGSGVDGAIHDAAGPGLYAECKACPFKAPRTRCRDGEAVITGGHSLFAKHVIHTVGPKDGDPETLASSYAQCLALARERGLTSIAFPCISTGVYGFPNVHAALVAISTALRVLQEAEAAPPSAALEQQVASGGEGSDGSPSGAGGGSGGSGGGGGGGGSSNSCGGARGGGGERETPQAEKKRKITPLAEQGEAHPADGEGEDSVAPAGSSSSSSSSSSSEPPQEPWQPSIVFCVFLQKDQQIYEALLPYFFPYTGSDPEQQEAAGASHPDTAE